MPYILLKNKFKKIVKYIDGFDYNNINYLDSLALSVILSNAIGYDNLRFVRWLHRKNINCFYDHSMNTASMYGHLNIVKWLHHNRSEGCTFNAMDYAASYNHLDVVKWLHSNRTEGCTTSAMDWATYYGDLDVVEWLHKNRTEGCTIDAVYNTLDNISENRNKDHTKRYECIFFIKKNYTKFNF
jgi:hypothetical protein